MLRRLLVLAVLGTVFSGCSGGRYGAGLPASPEAYRQQPGPVQAAGGAAVVSITVKVPAAATGAASISALATGGKRVVQNLSSAATGCTAPSGSNPLTCTFTIGANVATDVFTFVTYTGANGTGSQITTAKLLQKIAATGSSLSLTLSGTAAEVKLALPVTPPRQCDPAAAVPLYVMAQTAAGDFIAGSYGLTIHLGDADKSGDTSLSVSGVTSTAQSVTLNYNGYVLQSAKISPTAAGIAHANLHAATLSPKQMLYVTDFYNGVGEFPLDATGNVAPVRTWSLTSTAEDDWLTPDCKLYVTINGGDTVTIIPLQGGGYSSIGGSNTGLYFPQAVGVDSTGKIYVSTQQDTNTGKPGIEIYAPGSTGNATPIAFLGGSNTGMQAPNGLTIDSANNLYVADIDSYLGHAGVEVFTAGSTGNVAPSQFIYGSTVTAFGVAVDPSGNIWVANASIGMVSYGTIDEFPKGTNGDPTPSNSIDVNYAGGPGGIALDYKGNIHVNQFDNSTVLEYPAGASATTPPSAVLTGSNTKFSNAEDVAL